MRCVVPKSWARAVATQREQLKSMNFFFSQGTNCDETVTNTKTRRNNTGTNVGSHQRWNFTSIKDLPGQPKRYGRTDWQKFLQIPWAIVNRRFWQRQRFCQRDRRYWLIETLYEKFSHNRRKTPCRLALQLLDDWPTRLVQTANCCTCVASVRPLFPMALAVGRPFSPRLGRMSVDATGTTADRGLVPDTFTTAH